jgi:hypothetical protein
VAKRQDLYGMLVHPEHDQVETMGNAADLQAHKPPIPSVTSEYKAGCRQRCARHLVGWIEGAAVIADRIASQLEFRQNTRVDLGDVGRGYPGPLLKEPALRQLGLFLTRPIPSITPRRGLLR